MVVGMGKCDYYEALTGSGKGVGAGEIGGMLNLIQHLASGFEP